jgi:hypothetical protein
LEEFNNELEEFQEFNRSFLTRLLFCKTSANLSIYEAFSREKEALRKCLDWHDEQARKSNKLPSIRH